MEKSDIFVSVIAPLENDESIVLPFIEETLSILRENYSYYEVILVDDGSSDQTVCEIETALGTYECIRFIGLSRRFGEDSAILAGLDAAIGDFVVVMNPNDDPPDVIPEMVKLSQAGAGVVTGVRSNRDQEPYWARLGATLFYLYINKILNIPIPKNSSHYRVFSRQAINAIIQTRHQYRYIRMISSFVGYSQREFIYDPLKRTKKGPRRTWIESINMAIDIVITNSVHPLRIVSMLGLIASIMNLLYISYVLLVYFFKAQVAEGWTTTNFQNAVMFFFILLILTILSEYVAHILGETHKPQPYYVFSEKHSSVMLTNTERRNIVNTSKDQDEASDIL